MSADPAEVQQRWKGVAKQYPLWRFVFDLFFDVNSWRMIGADITTMVIQSKNAQRAVAALQGASAETIEALVGVAKVNESRSNDLFRAVFLGYVSVPIALGALLSDAAPDMLSEIIRDYATAIVTLLIGTVVFPIVYFCGNWRAKQISWVIDLYRAGAIAPLPEAIAQR
jgi:hypothetical protein